LEFNVPFQHKYGYISETNHFFILNSRYYVVVTCRRVRWLRVSFLAYVMRLCIGSAIHIVHTERESEKETGREKSMKSIVI